ncbi:MAG: hypothetical protein CMA78_03725 [Euryarchaeota archaeon]|nr:hypothetical protein [Euryarchaeota archaeon]|tara:strand:- start:47755 stop:48918 length:1164 start_codon:yes stop_codon:yes gene_type:complete
MHILVMSRSTLSHGFGGFERQCEDLCAGFVKAGHKVTVLTTSRKDGVEEEERSGYTVKFLSPSTPMKLSRSWFNRALSEVRKIHRDDPIDVIHSNEFAAKGAMGWAKKNGIPMAVVCHGSLRTELLSFLSAADMRPRYWHWLILTPLHLLRRCLLWEMPMRRVAKSIVLVSPTLSKDFKLFSKGKVRVIENGIALPDNSRERSTGEEIRLLCTGRADKQKGFQTAIRAVAEIDDMPLHLDIIGTGPYLDDLKKISRDLRTDERVTFHGRVTDDELNLAYSSADIYLIPTTRYEGLPLALLEAMAHGIPTISSEIGGNSDVITHNHDGIFIKPGNLSELISAIRRLGNDQEERRRISQAARATTERRFDKERMIDETLQTLESLTNIS